WGKGGSFGGRPPVQAKRTSSAGPLPPIPVRTNLSPALSPDNAVSGGKPSLVQIQEKLRAMKTFNSWDMDMGSGLWRTLESVEMGEIPELLAFSDRSCPAQVRQMVRHNLLARWANTDPQGAMSYADSVPNHGERNNAISDVAASWSSKEPEQAVAWAKKL